jgi:hypothetical protein
VIDASYCKLANVLITAADYFVPQHKKDYFIFWWDEELNLLKKDY